MTNPVKSVGRVVEVDGVRYGPRLIRQLREERDQLKELVTYLKGLCSAAELEVATGKEDLEAAKLKATLEQSKLKESLRKADERCGELETERLKLELQCKRWVRVIDRLCP